MNFEIAVEVPFSQHDLLHPHITAAKAWVTTIPEAFEVTESLLWESGKMHHNQELFEPRQPLAWKLIWSDPCFKYYGFKSVGLSSLQWISEPHVQPR